MLKSDCGDVHVPPSQFECTDDPSKVRAPVDWLIVTVKSFDTSTAAQQAIPMVHDRTLFVTFQNGVNNHVVLGRHFNAAERVFGGVTYTPAAIGAPGVVVHTGVIERYVWGFTKSTSRNLTDRADRLQSILVSSGIVAEFVLDAETTMWSKLCTKAAFDAVSVLGRYDLGTMISNVTTRNLFVSAMKEVFDVGTAKGISLDSNLITILTKFVFEEAAHETRSSMLNDLEAGKRIEIAELSGVVVAYGNEVGVPTPIHSMALAVLLPIYLSRSQGSL